VEKLIQEHQLLKSQISSTKYQINLKLQYSTRGASACAARDQNIEEAFIKFLPSSKFAFGILNFGSACGGLFVWNLLFVFWNFKFILPLRA